MPTAPSFPGSTIVAVQAAASTGDATQDFTSSRIRAAKWALFIVTTGKTDGVENNDAVLAIGATDLTRENTACFESEDAAGASVDTKRRATTTQSIVITNMAGGIDGEFSFSKAISGGVQITWDNNPADTYLITCVMGSGRYMDSYVGSFTTAGVQDSSETVSGPGFRAQAVIAWTHRGSFDDASSDFGSISVGVSSYDGSVVQGSQNVYWRDAQSSSGSPQYAVASDSYIMVGMSHLAITDALEVGTNANGFTLTPRLGAIARTIGYLALAFDDDTECQVNNFDSPTSTGNKAVDPGFTPRFVLQMMGHVTTTDTLSSTGTETSSLGLSVLSDQAGESFCNAVRTADGGVGGPTTETRSIASGQPVKYPYHDGTNSATASAGNGFLAADDPTMDGSGFTINYTGVDTTVRKWTALSIETDQGASYEPFAQASAYTGDGAEHATQDSGTETTYLMTEYDARIRQSGLVKGFRAQGATELSDANMTGVFLQAWTRNASGTYDLRDQSVDFLSNWAAGTNGVWGNYTLSSPFYAERGDYLAIRFTAASNVANVLSCTNSDDTNGMYSLAGSLLTGNVDFESGSSYGNYARFILRMDPPDVIAIGNSIVSGRPHYSFIEPFVTTEESKPWIVKTSNLCNRFTFQNMGDSGDRIEVITARAQEDVLDKYPKYCVFHSTSGVTGTWTAEEFRDLLDIFVQLLMKNDVIPILTGSNPNNDVSNTVAADRDTADGYIQTIASNWNVPYLSMMDLVGAFRVGGDPGNLWNYKSGYSGDGVHFANIADDVFAQHLANTFASNQFIIRRLTPRHLMLTI